jgi:hypothetical protein
MSVFVFPMLSGASKVHLRLAGFIKRKVRHANINCFVKLEARLHLQVSQPCPQAVTASAGL